MMYLTTSGNLWVRGSVTEASSLKWKENIRNFEEKVLEKIVKIPIRRFRRKDIGIEDIGIIAEELPEELRVYDNNGEVVGYNLSKLVIYLLKTIQELYYEIEKLKGVAK